MRLFGVVILAVLASALAKDCPSSKSNSKLFCYFTKLTEIDGCYCSHVILPANSDVKSVERVRQQMKGMKILVTVNEFNQGLINILKTSKVDGLEINLKKLDSKNDISDFISTVRSKLGSDLYLALSVPSKAETLAKYYDFKALSKHTDVFILQTAFLGASKNVTFHPSRLSGLWDMQNTDSIVDLVSGLGAPLNKVVITAPVQAFQFTLQNEEFSAPGSPALELKSLSRKELCEEMRSGSNWTLERDQDQAGPYIFSKNKWIAFEDSSSIDIKAKYSRIRGLAGLALKDLSEDGGQKCGSTILESAYNGLSRQARAPRGAVLHSLERELVESSTRPLDNVQISPYRITRIVDVEGHHHIIRQDTRTEFSCSRQGYFVHPRSCNRFYRCVKFDQLSDEYSVFEFDCPAGLAFDERVEVCVWPGSLPQGQACAGSSEIAPVPKERFVCPQEPGYYADPENCRWFFACLDHGKSPLSAYEFRCPFGLMFDSDRLVCEWSWLVPKCGSGNGLGINQASEYYYGGASVGLGYPSGQILEQYDGLGSLGLVKLGGINGKVEQPFIYSNIGGVGFQNGYTGGFGGLGIKATQSLHNAGLLKTGINGGSNIYESNIQYNSGTAGNSDISANYQENSDISNNFNAAGGIGGSSLKLAEGFGRFGEGTIQADLNRNAQYSSSIAHGPGIYESSAEQNGESQQNLGQNTQYISNDYGAKSSLGPYHEQAGANINKKYNSDLAHGSGQYQSFVGQEVGSQNADTSVDQGQYQTHTGSNEYVSKSPQKYDINSQYSSNSGLGSGLYQSSSAQTQGSQNGHILVDQGLNGLQYQTHSGSNEYGSKSSQNQYQGQASGNRNSEYSSSLAHGSGVYPSSSSDTKVGENEHVLIDQGQNSFQYQTHTGSNNYRSNNHGSIDSQNQYEGQINNQYSLNLGDGFNVYQSSNAGAENRQNENNGQYQTGTGSNYYGTQFSQSQSYGQKSEIGLTQDYVNNGLQSSLNNLNIQNQGQNKVEYQYNLGSNLVDGNSGTKSTQTFSQFHPQNEQGLDTSGLKTANIASGNVAQQYNGIYDSINIVGGGYSAVGKSESGVEIYDNGQSNLGVIHSTIAPLTVTTYASIPTVTSVPIPTLKTATGFESYKGGVIANIPRLQFKTFGQTKSSDFVKFISTTPSSLESGYEYKKPSVAFVEGQTYQRPSVPVVHQTRLEGTSQGATSYNYQSHTQGSTVDKSFTVGSTVQPELRVVQSVQEGYEYPKPNIQFEETSVKSLSPAVVTSYNYLTPTTPNPFTFEHESVEPVQPVVSLNKPVSYNAHISNSVSNGYSYEKPSIKFEETPQPQVVVSNYNEVSTPKPFIPQQPQVYVSSTVAPVVHPSASFNYVQGYDYQKPTIRFEERPTARKNPTIISKFTIRKPVVQETYVQPTISSNIYQKEFVKDGYNYEKPLIHFEEKPAIASHYIPQPEQPTVLNYNYSTQKTIVAPVVSTYQKPSFSTSYTFKDVVSAYTPATEKPLIIQQTYKPVVSTYLPATEKPFTYQQPIQRIQPAIVSSYHYQKPPVTSYTFNDVIRKPVQPVVSTYLPVTEKAFIPSTYRPISSTYLPITGKSVVSTYLPATEKTVIIQKPVSTYLPITEKPFQLPDVVPSYTYVAPSTPKPVYTYSSSTANPPVVFHQIFPTPSPTVVVQKQQNIEFKGYDYPKPTVSFVEGATFEESYGNGQSIEQPRVINYPRPSTKFVEKPAPFVETYENRQPIEEELFVKEKAYVTGNNSPDGPVIVESYQAPSINQNYESVRTKAFSQSVDTSNSYYLNNFNTVSSTVEPVPQVYVQSTPRPSYQSTIASVLSVKSKDSQEPKFYIHDSRLSTSSAPITEGYSYPTPEVSFKEEPVVSTKYLPVPTREYLPSQSSTTSRPISRFSFSSLDDEYQYVPSPVKSTTPIIRKYLPARQKVRVTTPVPTYDVPEVTREYLPVRSRVRYTSTSTPTVITSTPGYTLRKSSTVGPVEVTTLSREYLPVRSRIRVTTNGSPTEDGELEVTSRRPVQILKVARPATRTIIKQNDLQPFLSAKLGAQCTCVSNSLKSKKKQRIIIVEDDDDDDGYIVENTNQGGTVVENYQHESHNIVDITPTPQIYIKSTTNDLVVPTPSYSIRKRVRVSPVSTTTSYDLASDVGQYTEEDEIPSDKEIAKAVRTGLKLVKQAAKEGAREGAEEAISNYNPRTGNVRETIECQRAGLFRHPNQCNKFYACRWDCTKNKYTLHTFNCPVHLTFDNSLGACNWPSQGPACAENTLLPSD